MVVIEVQLLVSQSVAPAHGDISPPGVGPGPPTDEVGVFIALPKFSPVIVTDIPIEVAKFGIREKLLTGASKVKPMYEVPTRLVTVPITLRIPVPDAARHVMVV